MDGRNFNFKDAPEVLNGAYLEKMYDLQLELAEGYLKIEDLPRWPLNINSKKAQIILKDFAARVPEELAEGYESTHEVVSLMQRVGWNLNLLEDSEYQMILNHIQNSNEELADAMGFFLGLLMYSGITIQDLSDYADNPLHHLMLCLQQKGIQELYEFMPWEDVRGYNILERVNNLEEFKEHSPGFQYLSERLHEVEAQLLWQIQYHLGVARNYLKNKPWKQSEELSDELLYFRNILLAFVKMLGYAKVMGIGPEEYYRIFWKKNQTNRFRQKSMY